VISKANRMLPNARNTAQLSKHAYLATTHEATNIAQSGKSIECGQLARLVAYGQFYKVAQN